MIQRKPRFLFGIISLLIISMAMLNGCQFLDELIGLDHESHYPHFTSINTYSPHLIVTTPSYLGQRFQELKAINVSSSKWTHSKTLLTLARGLPLDIRVIPYGHETLIVLDRQYSGWSSLIWISLLDGTILKQRTIGDEDAGAQELRLLDDQHLAVTFLNQNEIWVVSPRTGEKRFTIPIDFYVGADGTAEAYSMAQHHNFLYVAIAGLDQERGWIPHPEDAYLLQISMDDFHIRNAFPLRAGNAWRKLYPVSEGIVIFESGQFQELDGLVTYYRFDDHGVLRDKTILVSEEDLGLEIHDYWPDRERDRIYLITSEDTFSSDGGYSFGWFDLVDNRFYQGLGAQNGGLFRSLFGMTVPGLTPRIYVASHHPDHTGLFVFSLEDPLASPTFFIPFPEDAPPESMTLYLP